MKGDPSPVNAGLLSAILRDVVSPQNARASPMRRSKSDDLNARNKAAFAEAKAAILAREANDGN